MANSEDTTPLDLGLQLSDKIRVLIIRVVPIKLQPPYDRN